MTVATTAGSSRVTHLVRSGMPGLAEPDVYVERNGHLNGRPHLASDQRLDLGQDVAGDSLVARAPAGESVSLVTPAAAAGREWDLVVVAGVQEGVWPDLRLRGSLLGSADLVDVVTGRGTDPRAARAQVRHDETRLFHVAASRATERLVVTAVRDETDVPSPFLSLLDGGAGLEERDLTALQIEGGGRAALSRQGHRVAEHDDGVVLAHRLVQRVVDRADEGDGRLGRRALIGGSWSLDGLYHVNPSRQA